MGALSDKLMRLWAPDVLESDLLRRQGEEELSQSQELRPIRRSAMQRALADREFAARVAEENRPYQRLYDFANLMGPAAEAHPEFRRLVAQAYGLDPQPVDQSPLASAMVAGGPTTESGGITETPVTDDQATPIDAIRDRAKLNAKRFQDQGETRALMQMIISGNRPGAREEAVKAGETRGATGYEPREYTNKLFDLQREVERLKGEKTQADKSGLFAGLIGESNQFAPMVSSAVKSAQGLIATPNNTLADIHSALSELSSRGQMLQTVRTNAERQAQAMGMDPAQATAAYDQMLQQLNAAYTQLYTKFQSLYQKSQSPAGYITGGTPETDFGARAYGP